MARATPEPRSDEVAPRAVMRSREGSGRGSEEARLRSDFAKGRRGRGRDRAAALQPDRARTRTRRRSDTLCACAAALNVQLAAFVEAMPGADLPRDIEHLRRQNLVVATAQAGGWTAIPEAALDEDVGRAQSTCC